MGFEQVFGVILGVFIGNALSLWFFYAIFWGEAQRKRGVDETSLPGWFYMGGIIPPLFVAFLGWVALY